MKEIVIISGKGGTGKTTLAGAFAALARDAVLADCDVDAPDLHIIFDPEILHQAEFRGGYSPVLDPVLCTLCGLCRENCRFEAIDEDIHIDPIACEGCGVCFHICPEEAITLEENVCGIWFISETRFGPFVHARLGIAQENSGKLVALVRKEAAKIAEMRGLGLILVDGPPGIGCPVISSLTGAHLVVAVTEPTTSGLHDLNRLVELVEGYFHIPLGVVINKHDLNLEVASRVESYCAARGLPLLGRIPFDAGFVDAMVQKKTLPEHLENGALLDEVESIWQRVQNLGQ